MTTPYDVLMILGGVLVLLIGLIDMISTTVVTRDGGGFVTRRTIDLSWRAWRWVSNLTGLHVSLASAPILVLVFAQWLVALLLGWTLIVHALTPPAPLFDQILSVMSLTIGRGKPPCDLPAWIAVGVGMAGVVLVSLTISYVIAVVSAVAYTRHVAGYLLAMGITPREIVERGYEDGEVTEKFPLHFISLAPLIAFVGTKTLAFPVIDVFQPAAAGRAISVRVGCVVQAVALVRNDPDKQPIPRAAEQTFLDAVDHLLEVYGYVHDDETDDGDDASAMEQRLTNIERWVEQSGWSWPNDVYRDETKPA